MGAWSRDKVNSSNINSGNEYAQGDRVSRQNLNAMVNAGLYAQDFAEHLADTPDTSAAGTVGTPSVTLVDNIVSGKTYKKFKFSNLKGQTGATGNGIASVSRTSTSGLTDTYTITFTNGSTTTFQVKNGDSVDMRVNNGYFQWKRTQDSTWTNLIAVSEIASVDQSLNASSTNAIANSAVATKFNNITSGAESVGKVTNGVYTTDFNTSNQTKFGDYIVQKKITLFSGEESSGTSPSSATDATGDITLSQSVSEGDVLEICFNDLTGSTRKIYHKFKVGPTGASTVNTYLKTNRWYISSGTAYNRIYFFNALVYINGTSLKFTPFSNITLDFNGTGQAPTQASVTQFWDCKIYEVNKIIG